MKNLLFGIKTIMPIFLLIGLGAFTRKIKILDENFISRASELLFKVALPGMIFYKISNADLQNLNEAPALLLILGVVSLGTFFLAWFIARVVGMKKERIGSFVQGAFRGNIAIVGLAIIQNLLSDRAFALGALTMILGIPLFNVLAVIILTIPLRKKSGTGGKEILLRLLLNPLILATVAAILYYLSRLPVPGVIDRALACLSAMTLPLALICIGGSLSFHGFKRVWKEVVGSSLIKLILVPGVGMAWAYLAGIRGEGAMVIFLSLGVPTAISSFVMARGMGNDSDLAGGIVALTTLLSSLTLALGISFLHQGFLNTF